MEERQENVDLINKNNFNCLSRDKVHKNRAFGRGHVVRQYMSGVGVITERYVPDDELLFYESGSSLDDSSSLSSAKSHEIFIDKDNEELNTTTVMIDCSCYEEAIEKERKNNLFLQKQKTKNSLFASILSPVMNISSRIKQMFIPK